MTISRYNHSLDYTSIALAAAIDGDFKRAGKALLKAAKQHDAKRAVQVLEASNAQAFDADIAARVTAKSKTKAAAKPAPVGAAKRVKAAAAPAKKTQVKAFDMGEDEDIDSLLEDGDEDMDIETDVEEAGADDMEEEEVGESDFDATFASVLRGMGAK
jgi:hypothetical protein